MAAHRTILAVLGRTTPQSRNLEFLLSQIGSEAALACYARKMAGQSPNMSLVIPVEMAESLNGSMPGDGLTVRSYGEDSTVQLDDTPRGTIRDVVLIDAAALPRVDLRALWRTHRRSRAAASVFYHLDQAESCRERVAVGQTSAVDRIVREYADSPPTRKTARVPLAVAVSHVGASAIRLHKGLTFAQLVDALQADVERLDGRVQWLRDSAVSGFPRPLDAALALVGATEDRTHPSGEIRRANATIAQGVRLAGRVALGCGVRIETGAIVIGPAAIGDHVNIRRGATISQCVVLPGTDVPTNSSHHRTFVGGNGQGQPSFVAPDQSRFHSMADAPNAGTDPTAGTHRRGERLKRGFDLVATGVAMVVLAPLFLATACAIRLTSSGPAFFRHRRQGRGGAEFDCWKFRTMVSNAERLKQTLRSMNQVDGPQFKIDRDPRITPLGEFLRRTNIDELPQLFNVFLGHMSLVGPRPSPDDENQWCPVWRRARLSVRPGITGLWQTTRSDDRTRTDFQEWIYYDMRYVENRSFRIDLQILWQTVRVLLGKGSSANWKQRWWPTDATRALRS